jgi:uncharacterized protein with FMN-binding domain
MKRAPIVLAGTVAGLAGVLAYHPASHASSLAASSAATASTPASTGAASTTATTKTTTATTTTAAKTSTAPDTSTAAKTGTAATTRSATGEDVQFQYGDIQVKVTVSGTKVTHVSIVSLNETDPHSQEIDAQAVPVLEQQTLSAGSAQIDGVSGASYTSQAYDRSLQSALDKLGITGSAA